MAAFLLPLSAHAGVAAGPDDETVWVEGESAVARQVTLNSWYDSVHREQLSGGAWLCHFGNTDGTAQYDLSIPKDAEYDLWIRGNPYAPPSYQVNGGTWTKVDASKSWDVINVAEDDKHDLRYLGWMRGGKVSLKKGPATLSFKFSGAANRHGSIDCFTLTTRAYDPRGTLKPGEVAPRPEVPALTDANLKKWIDFILPRESDIKWERLEWRPEFGAAIQEAKALQRPILLWTMNGHPLGCT
jgi:hypothetical protein